MCARCCLPTSIMLSVAGERGGLNEGADFEIEFRWKEEIIYWEGMRGCVFPGGWGVDPPVTVVRDAGTWDRAVPGGSKDAATRSSQDCALSRATSCRRSATTHLSSTVIPRSPGNAPKCRYARVRAPANNGMDQRRGKQTAASPEGAPKRADVGFVATVDITVRAPTRGRAGIEFRSAHDDGNPRRSWPGHDRDD